MAQRFTDLAAGQCRWRQRPASPAALAPIAWAADAAEIALDEIAAFTATWLKFGRLAKAIGERPPEVGRPQSEHSMQELSGTPAAALASRTALEGLPPDRCAQCRPLIDSRYPHTRVRSLSRRQTRL